MDYGEGIAAPIGGDTTTNDEQLGGERREGPPDNTGSALRDRPPSFLSERDVARRRADERRGGLDLIDGHTSTCRLLDRHAPQVAALCTADFVKVSKLHASLQATLQGMRYNPSPHRTEIHGHVHLHTGGVPPLPVGDGNTLPSEAVRLSLAPPDAPDTSGAELP